DVAGDVIGARRDPDRPARAGRGDRVVERGGRVVHAGGVGALADDRDRARGLGQRGGDVLEVFQLDRGAGRIGGGEQPVHLVVEVVRVTAARRVDERVAAVIPAVGVGQGEI